MFSVVEVKFKTVAVCIARVVPLNVKLVDPANAPALLYWTWLVVPPGLEVIAVKIDDEPFE